MGVLGTFKIVQKWLVLKTRNYQGSDCSTRTLFEKTSKARTQVRHALDDFKVQSRRSSSLL
jgi:hypothetical protein